MAHGAMAAQDKKWEAESDARTLSEAEAIKKDSARMKKAKMAAREMLKEKKDEVDGLARVAAMKKHRKKWNIPNRRREGRDS